MQEKDVEKYKCMGSVSQIRTFDESDTSELFRSLCQKFHYSYIINSFLIIAPNVLQT